MSDAVVWEIINHGHCSYKAKMERQNFCRNEYNVSGLCNRSSCPLANSRYATIREQKGRIYLYIKTIERSHTPKNLWQRIRLSRRYMTALQQVDEHLAHWPKFLVHKNKQRLTKITQYLIRMRKLALKPQKKIVTQPARLKKQEARKEKKAEKAADIEGAIEKELMTRLHAGTYGDIYNFPLAQYNKALDSSLAEPDAQEVQVEGEGGKLAAADMEGESEGDSDADEEEEFDSDDEEHMEFVEDLDESEDEDIEDIAARLGGDLHPSDGDSASDDPSGSEDGTDASDDDGPGRHASDGEDGQADGGAGPSKVKRIVGRAPKRRPRGGQDSGPKRKRGKEVELELEHERELAPRSLS